jgi:hypothetical protein
MSKQWTYEEALQIVKGTPFKKGDIFIDQENNNNYTFDSMEIHSETLEPMVSFYDRFGVRWTCPYELFSEETDHITKQGAYQESLEIVKGTNFNKGDIFTNRKNKHDYIFDAMEIHSKTLEPMVSYYDRFGIRWTRPYELFCEKFEFKSSAIQIGDFEEITHEEDGPYCEECGKNRGVYSSEAYQDDPDETYVIPSHISFICSSCAEKCFKA